VCSGVNAFVSICVSISISISVHTCISFSLSLSLFISLSLSLGLTHSLTLPLPLSRYTENIAILAKIDDANFLGASYNCLKPDSGQLAGTMWKDGQGHDCKVSVVSK
jgi:hypothetical protein